jgi:hypothetical protein
LIASVGAEVDILSFVLGQVGHQADEVRDAIEHHPHRPRGVPGVSSRFVDGRSFQNRDAPRAVLLCTECGAHGSVSGAYHHDIDIHFAHPYLDLR